MFIKNITNQPDSIEVGQIWWNARIKNYLLITGIADKETKIYRAIVLSRLTSLNDDNDILLKKAVYEFLSSDHIGLRVTDGPVCVKDLNLCIGHISKEDMTKVKMSLKMTFTPDDSYRSKVISDILKSLTPLRLRALREYKY